MRTDRYRRRRRRFAAARMAMAGCACAALVAACGSGGSGGGSSSSPSSPSTPSTTSSMNMTSSQGLSPSAGSGSANGGATSDSSTSASHSSGEVDAKQAIKNAYTTFFSPDSSSDETLNSLQNGQQFADIIKKQGQGSNSQRASNASATVTDIQVKSPDTATLRYTILVGDQKMLQDQKGYAVKQGGTWKMADYTFCGLMKLEMGNDAPQACQSGPATTPPT